MRDAHRMKEKLDLSLDNRQVVSVVIGSLVVLGAVFVLGVVVGKKLATTQGAPEAQDLLAAIDRKAQATEKVRAAPPLTFQEELTRRGVDPVVPDAGPIAAPPQLDPITRKPDPRAAGTGGSPPAERLTAPEPKPVSALPVAAPAVAAPVAAPPQVPHVPESTKAAPPEPAPAPRASSLRDAIARVERGSGAPAAAASASTGSFTLQLAALPSRGEADKRVSQLKEKGYAPYVTTTQVSGKGTFFRIRMGHFETREAAQKYLADFKRETHQDAFVTNVP